MFLMEFFVVSFKRNLFLKLLWEIRVELVFLEGLRTLSNVYEKVKIFKVIKKRKLRESEICQLV